jgi:hypothetical protein
MVIHMKVNGRMMQLTEEVSIIMQAVNDTMAIGKTTSETVKVS